MKIFIKTYGCQMNERDSEALAGMLVARGHEIVPDEASADVMVFNTCSVRDQAERKAVGKVSFMKKYKDRNPDLIIGVIGCMAQRRGEELLKEIRHLDFVLGTGKLHTLPDLIESLRAQRKRCSDTDSCNDVLTAMGAHYRPEGTANILGQIAITRGCNRFCSYCIVPYVRGREISRDMGDILAEARALVDGGVREILLLGQNVAAYGLNGSTASPEPENSPFADLLAEMAKIEGLHRIRYTSPYPTYFNDKLIRTIAENPKVCRNVHLPLQSGSDRILKLMNRQYTADLYREIAGKLRAAMPDITFSTDVIVGFPGETEEDFRMTRDLMNEIGFDQSFIFKYSPRPGAKSAAEPDSVPQSVKEERDQILLADLAERTAKNMANEVGSVQEVLAEGVSRRMAERWTGRTGGNRTVHFPPPEGVRPGDLLKIRIKRAGNVTLYGEAEKD
ncbi:MAG: tRNA (N6-isopentenyl adenosine(37)-C2)-methylthiotransferase MiaB [Lentisphaeria bacterium]|nr:tRNA (N6-isopentenyl adenosine(37)-C2)-methylthiotransferase MiaB [Lentisphaeria bacterium]